MKAILPSIHAWLEEEKPFALARVISTWGSSPRPVGSSMIISDKMEMAGSVSGGCVENAVVKAAQNYISASGSEELKYGVTDEDAWEVGLSCGGKINVFVQQFMGCSKDPDQVEVWNQLEQAIHANVSSILVTKLAKNQNQNALIFPDRKIMGTKFSDNVIDQAIAAFAQRKNQVVNCDGDNYFIHLFPRKNLLLIIGAAHITADLVKLGKMYDFEVVIIDPRGAFAQKTYFSIAPDQIIEKYPSEVLKEFPLDACTYAAILSHDPKIDDNALEILLKTEVAYIGALGSRKTHAKRVARLIEKGFSEAELQDKIDAPIGVDIKAKTPDEIALSIMGKIILAKNAFY